MPYGETKVYFDGSHYVAIPHTTRPSKRGPKRIEEAITVVEEIKADKLDNFQSLNVDENFDEDILTSSNNSDEPIETEITKSIAKATIKIERKMTRKELFNKLYAENANTLKFKRKKIIVKEMLPYFNSEIETEMYVESNIERKYRNLIARRIRCTRKANLQNFNYFCTFTYDGKMHSENSFRKGLKKCFANLCFRYGWKYIGVWERSPEKKRLHFHGMFLVPEGTMPEMLVEVNDYNFKTHKRQITVQNTYFNEYFGRSDFEAIENPNSFGDALSYILKYIEKTGEKIVYSKGLPQFFISDIMDNDIVCPIGQEDKKLLLYDDFVCWDEGCYMGKVSPEIIKQMRGSN